MICQTCKDLIAAAERILEERTAGESGSLEEWFYCPNCWFALVSINHQNLSAKTLLQRLELDPAGLDRQGWEPSDLSAPR